MKNRTPAKSILFSPAFLFASIIFIFFVLADIGYFFYVSHNPERIAYQTPENTEIVNWIVFAGIICLYSTVLFLVFKRRRFEGESGHFHDLLALSSNPVLVTDNSGIVVFANSAFEMWSGIRRDALEGRSIFAKMRISDQEDKKESIWVAIEPDLANGKAWVGEVELVRPDGREIYSGIIISPVLDAQGKLDKCIALCNNRTEIKQFARKIVETQKWYENIVESSLDGIIIFQGGKIVYVNPSAVRLFGYKSVESMKELDFINIIAPANRFSLDMDYERRSLGDEIFRGSEIRGLTRQGKMIDLEANAHVVDWNNRKAVQTSFRDITERKILEREQSLWLWEQETLSEIDRKLVGMVELEKIFSAILQQALNLTRAHFGGVILFDEKNEFVQWKAISGNTLQHTTEPFSPGEKLREIMNKDEAVVIHESGENANYNVSEIPVVGEEKLLSSVWLPLTMEGKQKGTVAVGYRHHHDFAGREMRLLLSIAEKHAIAMVNAQLYNNLLQREKELEILSGARVRAQEEERRRIAREIHDGLGQMLTAIKFNLEILEDAIDTGKEEGVRIKDMKKLLDDVMKEAREISYNLMPSVLEDFGLAPALQLLGEQFSGRTGIKVQYHAHNITERLPAQTEISLYRIVQESLNNISKHAGATEVNLQVIRHAGGIRVVIEDNGKGMSGQAAGFRATDMGGMGLVSMRERANSLGGKLTIDSMPKSGTLITVEIPLAKKNTHE